jgi:hypothetical protein
VLFSQLVENGWSIEGYWEINFFPGFGIGFMRFLGFLGVVRLLGIHPDLSLIQILPPSSLSLSLSLLEMSFSYLDLILSTRDLQDLLSWTVAFSRFWILMTFSMVPSSRLWSSLLLNFSQFSLSFSQFRMLSERENFLGK